MTRSIHLVRTATAVLSLGLSALFTACEAPGTVQDSRMHGDPLRLVRRQPADIAVAPIRDQTGRDTVPRPLFREAFQETLVEKLYSPLDAKYVEANWVEGSFRGTPPPDGLLLVVIDHWDPARLYSAGIVTIGRPRMPPDRVSDS